MYNVTLVNLAPDARSAVLEGGRMERVGVRPEEVRRLLANFCEIDPVENASADSELRVLSSSTSWLLRASQRKLILYDARDREAPGHIVTAEEAMAEIDGTAAAARAADVLAATRPPIPLEPEAPAVEPPPLARRPVRILGAVAALLLAAALGLEFSGGDAEAPLDFVALGAAEAREAGAALAGVYVTGMRPGQHGIVVGEGGEVRIFEFQAQDAPRFVQAHARLGRVGGELALATDQPGGLIRFRGSDTLVYCGETYTRLP